NQIQLYRYNNAGKHTKLAESAMVFYKKTNQYNGCVLILQKK
ncbi:MAG: hypothetical protein RL115_674, partial [Bacteroidota bacterium]